MSFRNRSDAGRKLPGALVRYQDQHPVILALPRGGVPVAAEVAAALDAPLDLIIARKIGLPSQPELAMGAVVDGEMPIVVRNEDVILLSGVREQEFEVVCDAEIAEIMRRRQRYLGHRERADITGRTAIVIDDGIATGATTRVALRAIRARNPKKLVLAVPVAPSDTLAELRSEGSRRPTEPSRVMVARSSCVRPNATGAPEQSWSGESPGLSRPESALAGASGHNRP
ncbi:phosphoribosyltransferase family protein [Microvirga terrestris]|uniref:Phosphoribosyltransferase n=1 Tax=Microvirga terrestris TaxID=2791024 RepID=A0ABS0HTW1_9HYPH|nr:phosphoribosyltransferase [Microvirga terrestris]